LKIHAPIDRVDIQYQAETYVDILNEMDSIRQNNARASLSWRLTTREKVGVVENIHTEKNKEELERLRKLLYQTSSPALASQGERGKTENDKP
jgi:hypothetical protein